MCIEKSQRKCALCCLIFSAFAVIILATLGFLLAVQPQFIVGIEQENSKSGCRGCFGAAGVYFAFFLTSAISLWVQNFDRGRKRSRNEDEEPLIPHGHGGFSINRSHAPELRRFPEQFSNRGSVFGSRRRSAYGKDGDGL